jgi:hypothetical protein
VPLAGWETQLSLRKAQKAMRRATNARRRYDNAPQFTLANRLVAILLKEPKEEVARRSAYSTMVPRVRNTAERAECLSHPDYGRKRRPSM